MAIKGLKELQQKLSRLPDRAKLRIREGMEAGADEIVALAKSLVPVADGALRDSITWIWGDAPKGLFPLAAVTGSIKGANDLRITIVAGDDEAYYARWVEFGTAAHNILKGGGTKAGQKQLATGGGRGHPGTAAQPFFYVSYRALRKRTKSRITRAINKAAKEVAAGGA